MGDVATLADDIGETETALIVAYSSAVVSFGFVYYALRRNVRSEIRLISRYLRWLRYVVWALVLSHLLLFVFETQKAATTRFVWPNYGIFRPGAGLLACLLSAFSDTHVCFRWIAFLWPALFITVDTLMFVSLRATIACREAGTCEATSGFSVDDLAVLAWRDLVAIFLHIWLMLVVAATSMSMGMCHARYPVRVFSASNPVSEVPVSHGGHKLSQLEYAKVA
mmetsp:Transcript_123303/g.343901  ORF Transcript_123303/g.343901 Transcript_123303/m.343901 type:complete len:223 (-) Transcript_123303:67-735(-)